MLTIYELKHDAIEELKNRLASDESIDQDNVSDVIHEVAENWIPVYTRELIELTLSNFDLICVTPE